LEPLTPDFRFDAELLENRINSLRREFDEMEFDRDLFRDKLVEKGFEIRKLALIKPPDSVELLAVDSSIVKAELRFFALWALHCVVLRACFDGRKHRDSLVGGEIWYRNLMYNSFIDAGQIKPYRLVEEKTNNIRILKEYESIRGTFRELRSGGCDVDYLLVDGSLYTNHGKLSRYGGGKAPEEYRELIGEGRVVGMAEDSHAGDLADKVGLDCTNLMLLDLILDEKEYVVHEREDINICYLKLPSKKLSYTLEEKSPSLTVRWEFPYREFREDLGTLAYMWSQEDDLLHPQVYPIRVADYLTRRVKMQGLLERLIEENNLMLRYRDLRESGL